MPEPCPDQELLILLRERNSNRRLQRPQKRVKKGSSFRWQEIQMNE